jgi:hypothetical protein
MKSPYVLLALMLALPGCNKEAAKPTGGTADGEILPGSASDAMLPLDTLRSQPPLAPKVEASGKPAGKGEKPAAKGTTSDATAAALEPATAPEPVAEPAPAGE